MPGSVAGAAAASSLRRSAHWRVGVIAAVVGPPAVEPVPAAICLRSRSLRSLQQRFSLHGAVLRKPAAAGAWHTICRSSTTLAGVTALTDSYAFHSLHCSSATIAAEGTYASHSIHCSSATINTLSIVASSIRRPRASSGTSKAVPRITAPPAARTAGVAAARWSLSKSYIPAAAAVRRSQTTPVLSDMSVCNSVRQHLMIPRRNNYTRSLLLVRCSSTTPHNVSVAEYCLRPRCTYTPSTPAVASSGASSPATQGEQPHVDGNINESSSRRFLQKARVSNVSGIAGKTSTLSSSSSSLQSSRRGADLGRELAVLRGPADPLQDTLPLLSFSLFTDACCNARCRAEAIVGEVPAQTPRSFKLLIDGSAYALIVGLLLLLLTSNLTVVERRVDAHLKSLALLAAAYGTGIGLWGCEVAAFGKRSVFPAGAPRYILGLIGLWLCVPVLALPESAGPVAGYAALVLPVTLQLLLPRLLFTERQRREAAAGGKVRGGGGWIPQWWGSSRSQQLLPFAALASAAVGIVYVGRVEAGAASEIDAAAAEAAAALDEVTGTEPSSTGSSFSKYGNYMTSSRSSTESCVSFNSSQSTDSESSDSSSGTSQQSGTNWIRKAAAVLFRRGNETPAGAIVADGGGQTAEEAQRERADIEVLDLTRKRLLLAKQQREQNALQQQQQPQKPPNQQQKEAEQQPLRKQEGTGDHTR